MQVLATTGVTLENRHACIGTECPMAQPPSSGGRRVRGQLRAADGADDAEHRAIAQGDGRTGRLVRMPGEARGATFSPGGYLATMTVRKSSPRPNRRVVTTIRELQDPADPALAQAYRLLTRTFHRGERVLRREWTGSLRERRDGLLTDIAWHLIVAERNGRVVGFTSGSYLGNVNLGVVGYLAIAPDVRAGGLGTRLRGRLRSAFAKDAARIARRPLDGILGEVSADNPWLRSLARRPEVLALDFPYYQPRLSEDDAPSPYVLYLESLLRHRDHLTAAELRRILYTLWRRVYRIGRPLDRPAFRAMLRALQGRRTVGRLLLPDPKTP
jgi:hypothetical protein